MPSKSLCDELIGMETEKSTEKSPVPLQSFQQYLLQSDLKSSERKNRARLADQGEKGYSEIKSIKIKPDCIFLQIKYIPHINIILYVYVYIYINCI